MDFKNKIPKEAMCEKHKMKMETNLNLTLEFMIEADEKPFRLID